MKRKIRYQKEEPRMLHPHTDHYLIAKNLNQLKKASDFIVDLLEIWGFISKSNFNDNFKNNENLYPIRGVLELKDRDIIFDCDICGETFRSKDELEKHIEEEHTWSKRTEKSY